MPTLRVEGLVPIVVEDLWRLLALHMDEDTLRAIHPWVLHGRVVAHEGQQTYAGLSFPTTHVVEREVRIARRTLHNTWTYRIVPPITFGYEIRGSAGFVSTFDNTYSEEAGETRVVTRANLNIGRVPGFLQRRIANRFLAGADDEDLAYVRRQGFRTIGEVTRPKGT